MALAACSGAVGDARLGSETLETRLVKGQIELTVPEGWRELPVKSEAVLSGMPGHEVRKLRFIGGEATRTPLRVSISIEDGPILVDDAWRRGEATYTLAPLKHDGTVGSGGEEYVLTAVRPLDDKWLQMEAYQQSEFSAPGFAAAWAAFESVTLIRDESAK